MDKLEGHIKWFKGGHMSIGLSQLADPPTRAGGTTLAYGRIRVKVTLFVLRLPLRRYVDQCEDSKNGVNEEI